MAGMRLTVVTLLVLSCLTRPARAAPWFGWGEGSDEERYADGDVDFDDLLVRAPHLAPRRTSATFVALTAFGHERRDGPGEVGVLLLAGMPLERLMPSAERGSPKPRLVLAAAPRSAEFALSSPLARAAVGAALQASGLGDGEAEAAMASRARLAALLPEARLRAMRTTDQTARVDSASDEQRTTDAIGANLWLEARLTWRFDRLVYADDEPQLERIRGDRLEARAKLAMRTVELLVKWHRAKEEARLAPPDGPEEREAELRALEAAVALDVLTAGWFGTHVSN